jgi:sec-independent protein translocase protein TatC
MQDLTFWDHLDDLRRMLIRSFGAVLVLSIAFFVFMPRIFDSVVMGPCFGEFPPYRWISDAVAGFGMDAGFSDSNFKLDILNLKLASQFMIHLWAAFLFGLLVAFPYILFELWRFVAPALFKKERRSFKVAFLLASILFYTGLATGYFLIFPITLRFLAGYEITTLVSNQISLDSYVNSFASIIFSMGLVFEFPVLALILSGLGLVKRSFFSQYRKHAIVVLVIIAAIITPTGDPFTLTLVTLPLWGLYELSALLVKK